MNYNDTCAKPTIYEENALHVYFRSSQVMC